MSVFRAVTQLLYGGFIKLVLTDIGAAQNEFWLMAYQLIGKSMLVRHSPLFVSINQLHCMHFVTVV